MNAQRARHGRFGLLDLTGAISLGLGLTLLLLASTRTLRQERAEQVPSAASPADDGSGYDHIPQGMAGAVTLTRGPYLQSVTTDSIIIVWDTDQPATSLVDYGPTAAHGLVASNVIPVTHHALTLTTLGPYSIYHYQISSNGRPLGGDNTFRTAASPTQTTFSFVVFGDTRTNVEAHQSVVNRAVTLSPDFVLHTGDFVADGHVAAQWTTFFTVERDLLRQSPLFGVPGNHERNSVNYFAAFHLPGNERWYSFDYGDAHFIALQVDGYADYAPGSAQYTWLENDLASSDRLWKFVFFHIPPYSSGPHGGDTSMCDTLGPLFAQHSVDLVLNGHDHDYERSVVSDVVYIVTGGGGAPLYGQTNPNPYSVYFTSTHHCVYITVNSMSLSSVGVQPEGVQFDSFTVYKHLQGDHTVYLPLTLRQR